jgi:oligosaccharide repeat unit polymerase
MEYFFISLSLLIGALYLVREARVDVFSPVVLAMFMLLFFYVLDFVFILFDASENSGFWLSGLYFRYDELYFLNVSVIIFCAVSFWVFGDWLASVSTGQRFKMNDRLNFELMPNVRGFGYFISVVFVLSVGLSLLQQINSTVGFSVYMGDMASRSMVFESFTIQNALLHVAVLLGGLVSSYLMLVDSKRFLGGILLILCVGVAFVTGGRAIVLMVLLTFAYVYHYAVRKIEFDLKLVVVVFSFAILLPFVALLTRTSSEFYDGSIFSNIFNTGQVPQANNLLLLSSSGLGGDLLGSSLVNDIFSFVPGFVFSFLGLEKEQGGNTDFTIYFWPDRWEVFKSQISLGGVGELYYNFSYIGVAFGCFLMGFFYKWYYYRLPFYFPNRNLGFFLVLPLYWSIFQQFRGDYFHTVNKLFLFSIAVVFFSKFILGKYRN